MKKVGLFLGIALFCLGGYMIYLFEFKTYDVADAKVDEITGEEYIITLSDGSKIILDGAGNLIRREDSLSSAGGEPNNRFPLFGLDEFDFVTASNERTSNENSGVAIVSNEKEKMANQKLASSLNDKEKTKLIKQKYEAIFTNLEEQSMSRLYNLIDLAKNEYYEKQAADQAISYPYFYNKYTTAASDLEKQTDLFFYALTKSMQQELKANGLPKSITNAYTEKYENRKEKLRNELLKEAAGM